MYLKKYKPVTNGVRHKLSQSSYFLNEKKLNFFKVGFKKHSGRGVTGQITVRHRLNYTSKSYLVLDFKRTYLKVGTCFSLTKDPNRNAIVALIKFSTGSYSYVLAPHGFINGAIYQTITKPELFSCDYKVGFNVFLLNLQAQSIFFNLEIIPGNGSKYSRTAGTYCTLINTDVQKNTSKIKLPSSTIIIVSSTCLVTLGRCSNIYKNTCVIGNAGFNIRKGFKSSVRGVAMNPVDHPHGGRTKTNSPELTPWGKIAKFNK